MMSDEYRTNKSPQEHYEKAEELNRRAYHFLYGDGADTSTGTGFATMALVHATLAHAGFLRDSAANHVHDVVTQPVLGGYPMRATTAPGRPA